PTTRSAPRSMRAGDSKRFEPAGRRSPRLSGRTESAPALPARADTEPRPQKGRAPSGRMAAWRMDLPGEIQEKALVRSDGLFVDDHGRGNILEGGAGAVEESDLLRCDAAGFSPGAELRELGVDAGPLDRPRGQR